MIGTAASFVIAMAKASKERDKYLNSLSKEEADEILRNEKIEYEKELEHKQNVEIANALRPRNFWGK
jgi:hypothetical protein